MKFDVNYNNLDGVLNRPKFYKYSDVKGKLVKVAFDVVRFMEKENIDGLWQIQKTDDGEVILAMYEDEEKHASSNNWNAVPDKTGQSVTVFYKNEPVKNIASAEFGIDSSEISSLCSSLKDGLNNNATLRSALFAELPEVEKTELLKT